MITRHPDVPDNIFELERHNTVGDYARAYGDELMRRYEDFNIIYIPYFPLDFDLELFQSITFPSERKKLGDVNGLSDNVFIRRDNQFGVNQNHVLIKIFGDPALAAYLQSQIASVNRQIDAALRILFPKYYSLKKGNISWRMTETVDEGLHVDGFLNGVPLDRLAKKAHRIKAFVNIDTSPRHWSTSYTIPDLLRRRRDHFPNTMPDDIDAVATFISRSGMLNNVPTHEIHYPTMSAVIGEAQAITHAIRYGRRMVAAEYMCAAADMLNPAKNVHAQLAGWLGENKIAIGPMPQPFAQLLHGPA